MWLSAGMSWHLDGQLGGGVAANHSETSLHVFELSNTPNLVEIAWGRGEQPAASALPVLVSFETFRWR
jgi:hypothetical protein